METCKTWGLGHDKDRKCLVFPVRRYDGKLIGMTGRYVYYPNSPTKYHNYAGLNKSRYLFGEHMLKHKEPVIICEGQVDAIMTWQHLGVPTVASLGEGFGAAHAKTIAAFMPPVVYLFFDNDAAGRMAAEKVEYQLRGRVSMKLMVPPVEMDPGEMSKEQTERAFRSAIPITPGFEWSSEVFLSHNEDGKG
jgi:DNA primase